MNAMTTANSSSSGIIICDHGSRRTQSNDSLKYLAERFALRFAGDCQIVEPAHMELAMPDIATAYAACVSRGARHIVVLPLNTCLKEAPIVSILERNGKVAL